MYGRAEMSEEPRTEVLRRRIELYLHCICDGITTAKPSEFIQQIAEAEDESLMLTTESTFRYGAAAHRADKLARSLLAKQGAEPSGNCIKRLPQRTAPAFDCQQPT